MRPLVALLAAAMLALPACGGSGGPDGVVSETADKLGEISSGELFMRLVIQPRGGDDAGDIGFELKGPFALGEGDDPPLANVRYKQLAAGEDAEVTLVSAKEGGFVFVDGQAYELPPDRIEELRAFGSRDGDGDPEALGGLELDDWLENGKLQESGELDRVTGTVDVEAAVADLLELANDVGSDVPESLADEDRKRLAEAVRSSRFELETGKEDRLLRWLHVDADFGLDVPEQLQGTLGRLVGAKVIFELGFRNPNEPIEVKAPEDALPYSALD
jgi:hypothetical protein